MSRMEDELRKALCREEPSPRFTDRVMAGVDALRTESKQWEGQREGRHRRWLRRLAEFFQPFHMKWATVGAALLLTVVTIYSVHRFHEDQRRRQQALAEMIEGERAKEQVVLAMMIASEKLNIVQKKVQETMQR
jgi:hypothetical protein